jgi:HPt (histidine-containing phosphotransfer) domain-containing protein
VPAPNGATAAEPDEAESASDMAVDTSVLAKLRRELQMEGAPDVIGELAAMFIHHTPDTIRRLREAVTAGDPGETRAAAHELKGSAANMGARHLSTLSARIEAAARAGTLADTAGLLAELDSEFARVSAQLEREVGQVIHV